MTTRLSIRINKLSAHQRLLLCRKLGIGNTTLYRRLEAPRRNFSLEEVDRLKAFFDKLDEADYNMEHLLKAVELGAAKHPRLHKQRA